MLQDLQSPIKAVYEISGAEPEPGIITVDEAELKAGRWDLILSCHVLEHVPDPGGCVAELARLGHADTVYFFELPREEFKSFAFNRSHWQKHWIEWAVRKPMVFKLLDFLSTGTRIKTGRVLPLLFVALREHLTFFTVSGLTRLVEASGLRVLSAGIRGTGNIIVVAQKTTG